MARTGSRLKLFTLACACASALAGVASAQSIAGGIQSANAETSDAFARDRGVTVRDRPRPEYEALGVPVGAFTLFPRLQVDVESTDNVYAADTNTESDVIGRLRPDLSLRSDWSRHALSAFVRASTSQYSDFSTENATDWATGANGRLDISRDANLNAGVIYGKANEPRTAAYTVLQADQPIQYDYSQSFLAGAVVLNRLKVSGRLDYQTYDYDDGVTTTGLLVEEDDRDRKVFSGTGRVDYAVSPATAIFVQATGNTRDYKKDASLFLPPRDSNGYEALVGANFEPSALIRGEVAVGYIEQSFDNVAYKEISGFGSRATLTWMPTELTTVTFAGSRTIEDAQIIGSAGYLVSQGSVQVDHELLRNLILTGVLSVGRDDFDDINRLDKRWGASFSGTYLLNRNLGVALAVSHTSRSSDAATNQDYDLNRVTVSLISQF